MPIGPGTRLGPYEVIALIGEGGMGEVYRATDTNLKRAVAIKVLPESVAADKDRLARFQREAEVLASLNHPNIAAIYGLERSDGTTALVMELVEGTTLADRIAQGPLSVTEVLAIAKQTAEAVEAAHENGIIHRDLKPANIKLRPDGTVKVLDFGLAKATRDTEDFGGSQMATALKTEAGAVVGTPAYMSPEQARGLPIDQRTDIWAFGCLIYQMMTGRNAFTGSSVADTLAAILEREPDWKVLPSGTPPRIRLLLSRCLQKNPRSRLHHIADARLEIEDALTGHDVVPVATVPHKSYAHLLLVGTALVGLVLGGFGIWVLWRPSTTGAPSGGLIQTQLQLGAPLIADQSGTRLFALSPDGRRLVYVGRHVDGSSLYVQNLTSGEVTPLAGTEGAETPFFSPDGEWIGFVDRADEPRLKKVRTSGGLPVELGPVTAPVSSASWTMADEILLASSKGLISIPSTGGGPKLIVPLGSDDGRFDHPHLIETAGVLLFSVRSKSSTRTDDDSQIGAMSLRTGERKILVSRGSSPIFVQSDGGSADGHLVYSVGGQLLAAPFDAETLALTAAAVPVAEDVQMRANGDAAQFSLSPNGSMAALEAVLGQLVWVDRSGMARPLSSSLRRFAMPRISPDGNSLAVEIQDTPHQVWLLDLGRDILTPLTTSARGSHNFAWAPDGESLAVTVSDESGTKIEWIRADGSGQTKMLFAENGPWVNNWSSDGRWLALYNGRRGSGNAVLLPIEGTNPPQVIGPTKPIAAGVPSDFSPDGAWLAYVPNGRTEVFIQRLVDNVRFQVSDGGGWEPVWSPKSNELFFRTATHIMVAEINASGPVGRPKALFQDDYRAWGDPNYDVTAAGDRFVMVRSASESSTTHVNLLLNWTEELNRLVPVN